MRCGVQIRTLYPMNKKTTLWVIFLFMAEIGGFEPSIQFPVYTISSRAHSTSSAISPVQVLYTHLNILQGDFLRPFFDTKKLTIRLF